MKTHIRDAWESFVEELPKDLLLGTRESLRRSFYLSFYCGAWALFQLTTHFADQLSEDEAAKELAEDEAAKELEHVHAEFMQFLEEMGPSRN
jgi:hypothetical protein